MRVAKVDGLVTLFYDGSKKPFNRNLHDEWWKEKNIHNWDSRSWEEQWEEWTHLSSECREYWQERQSWQQVIVMEGVTVIPRETFQHCFNIKKVIFANTVVRIEYRAFLACQNLVDIKLPTSLVFIALYSFFGCNLFSVFIPPECKEIGSEAFSSNQNLTIINVPPTTKLGLAVVNETKLIADSSFGNEYGYYNSAHEEVHNWMKNINNDAKYALHRACCSFQPLKEVIFTILKEKGIGVFKVKNEAGITPSRYLKENPYADIDEMEIIRDFALKIMGEI